MPNVSAPCVSTVTHISNDIMFLQNSGHILRHVLANKITLRLVCMLNSCCFWSDAKAVV